MNDIILTAVIYLVIFGLPIWFCIEIYLLAGAKYPEMRKDGWI